jgi:hypothetical protein
MIIAAEHRGEEEDVADRRDGAGDHRRDRRHEDVAVLDVRELVRHDRTHLVVGHVL